MITKINMLISRWLLATTGLIFMAANSFSQDARLKYMGVESGMNFIESKMTDIGLIRGDIPNYYIGFSATSLTTLSYAWYAGVKSEVFSLNDRFGLSAGIRFSRLNNTIGKEEYWRSNTNYFYWLFQQDGTETEFLKIREIGQKTDYLGIPLELRFLVSRRPHIFQIYGKVGAVTNFRVKTTTRVVFKDPAMEVYEKDVSDQIKEPGPVSFAMYVASGFKIGTDQKPSISIEACFPYFVLNPHASGMLNPLFGGGFQLTFQVPIKSSVK
jgi:hypothetical protein